MTKAHYRKITKIMWAKRNVPPPLMSGTKPHPEDQCQKCHGANVVWYTSSEAWNRTIAKQPIRWTILCPVCFIKLAEALGPSIGIGRPTAWRILPERSTKEEVQNHAAALGKLAAGHKKDYSKAERERRRKRMKAMNELREQRKARP